MLPMIPKGFEEVVNEMRISCECLVVPLFGFIYFNLKCGFDGR